MGGGLALRMGALTLHQREVAKAQATRAVAERARSRTLKGARAPTGVRACTTVGHGP